MCSNPLPPGYATWGVGIIRIRGGGVCISGGGAGRRGGGAGIRGGGVGIRAYLPTLAD